MFNRKFAFAALTATPFLLLLAVSDGPFARSSQKGDAGAPVVAAAESRSRVLMANQQVVVKRAALKVAEARKKVATAKLGSVRSLVAEAKASVSFAWKQLKRFEELEKGNSVSMATVEERRKQFEAAKARSSASAGGVSEGEAQVVLEEARVELAKAELDEAELRLAQVKGK